MPRMEKQDSAQLYPSPPPMGSHTPCPGCATPTSRLLLAQVSACDFLTRLFPDTMLCPPPFCTPEAPLASRGRRPPPAVLSGLASWASSPFEADSLDSTSVEQILFLTNPDFVGNVSSQQKKSQNNNLCPSTGRTRRTCPAAKAGAVLHWTCQVQKPSTPPLVQATATGWTPHIRFHQRGPG